MGSSFERRARHLLERPRRVGALAGIVAAEAVVRGLAGLVHPLLVVLVPPVVAVAGLAAIQPICAEPSTGSPETGARSERPGPVRPRLLLATVLAHGLAVLLGTGLFLVVDTAGRALWYAAGGGSFPAAVVYYTPLLGVGLGTVLAWAPFVPAVDRVARGASLREGIGFAATLPAAAPRTALSVAAAHLVAGALLGVVVGVAVVLSLTGGFIGPGLDVSRFLAVGVALGGLAGVVASLVLVPLHSAVVDAVDPVPDPPVARLVLAVLVLAGLAVGAGAVRVTETRPLAAETDPLPDDPDAAYATALENTERLSHNVTYVEAVDGLRVTNVVDRRDRQFRQVLRSGGGPHRYYYGQGAIGSEVDAAEGIRSSPVELGRRDAGGWGLVAHPGYQSLVEGQYEIDLARGLPAAGTGGWSVAERREGSLVLELTDPEAVYRALRGPPQGDVTAEAASVRMRIDADRGVVLGGSARLNATVDGSRIDVRERYLVRTGSAVDVEYPVASGPSAGEWVWRLFAY